MKRPELLRFPGVRSGLLLILYSVVLALSYWLAYQLRFDFHFAVVDPYADRLHLNIWWAVPVQLIWLYMFGQFSGLLSYFSLPDLRRLSYANLAGSASIFAVGYLTDSLYSTPRGVVLLNFLLSFLGLSVLRVGFRTIRERYLSPQGRASGHSKRVGIVGAGDVGANLARELSVKRGLGLHPVAFFDDDKTKWRSRVHDIPVVGAPEAILNNKLNLELDEVIIAMPSASAKRIGEVVRLLQKAHLQFETVPSLDQLATGQVKVSQLRNVEIQDLLGREPIKLEPENIREILRGRIVMVTGAGGSIGSELCRQIAAFHPQRLLLLEQSEVQMFQIEQELIQGGHGSIVLPLIADVLDQPIHLPRESEA